MQREADCIKHHCKPSHLQWCQISVALIPNVIYQHFCSSVPFSNHDTCTYAGLPSLEGGVSQVSRKFQYAVAKCCHFGISFSASK